MRGLARAAAAGVPTFVVAPGDYADRGDWDEALAEAVAEHNPRFVVSAGFMRLLGPAVLAAFRGASTPTPRCCPPSPARTRCATRSRTA